MVKTEDNGRKCWKTEKKGKKNSHPTLKGRAVSTPKKEKKKERKEKKYSSTRMESMDQDNRVRNKKTLDISD